MQSSERLKQASLVRWVKRQRAAATQALNVKVYYCSNTLMVQRNLLALR